MVLLHLNSEVENRLNRSCIFVWALFLFGHRSISWIWWGWGGVTENMLASMSKLGPKMELLICLEFAPIRSTFFCFRFYLPPTLKTSGGAGDMIPFHVEFREENRLNRLF